MSHLLSKNEAGAPASHNNAFIQSATQPHVSAISNLDDELSAAIVGTWISTHALGWGETTYFLDGTAEAFVYSNSHDLRPLKAKIKGRWEIVSAKLNLIVLETDPPGVLPPGHGTSSQIESLTYEELVLVTVDGTRLADKRKRGKRAF